MANAPLALFEGFGIELEYMIVDAETLAVKPIADKLIHGETGAYDDVVRGPIGWSNELVAHVIELKTNGPAASLGELWRPFADEVAYINQKLRPLGAQLMPTGMHPFMHPDKEMVLWPHESSEIYARFDQIFNCKGHGWSNLQSCHINLPFRGDEEFGALHAAIRLLLPILPALAASSPLVEGKATGIADNRLAFYRNNAMRVPSVSGQVVPEQAFTRKDYEMNILARIYQDLAPFDPDGILQHEWANARGAIARFDRDAIEIRVLDVQECPKADIAIATAVVAVLKAVMGQRWLDLPAQKKVATKPLGALFARVANEGGACTIESADYLAAFGLGHRERLTAGELWQHLIDTVWPKQANVAPEVRAALGTILTQGNLSRRIDRLLGPAPRGGKGGQGYGQKQREIYEQLCRCLAEGRMLEP